MQIYNSLSFASTVRNTNKFTDKDKNAQGQKLSSIVKKTDKKVEEQLPGNIELKYSIVPNHTGGGKSILVNVIKHQDYKKGISTGNITEIKLKNALMQAYDHSVEYPKATSINLNTGKSYIKEN